MHSSFIVTASADDNLRKQPSHTLKRICLSIPAIIATAQACLLSKVDLINVNLIKGVNPFTDYWLQLMGFNE